MNDVISRKAVFDALAKAVPYAICDESTESYTNGLTDAYNLICQLPSAQPEQQWIPSSERLPENKSYVLTTIFVPGRSPHTRSGWFEDGLFMNDNGDTWKCTDREVIAWMPLPDPYKGEEDE